MTKIEKNEKVKTPEIKINPLEHLSSDQIFHSGQATENQRPEAQRKAQNPYR